MTIDYQAFMMGNMKTNEAIAENEDGSYSIFINERLCEKEGGFDGIRKRILP